MTLYDPYAVFNKKPILTQCISKEICIGWIAIDIVSFVIPLPSLLLPSFFPFIHPFFILKALVSGGKFVWISPQWSRKCRMHSPLTQVCSTGGRYLRQNEYSLYQPITAGHFSYWFTIPIDLWADAVLFPRQSEAFLPSPSPPRSLSLLTHPQLGSSHLRTTAAWEVSNTSLVGGVLFH